MRTFCFCDLYSNTPECCDEKLVFLEFGRKNAAPFGDYRSESKYFSLSVRLRTEEVDEAGRGRSPS